MFWFFLETRQWQCFLALRLRLKVKTGIILRTLHIHMDNDANVILFSCINYIFYSRRQKHNTLSKHQHL